MPESRWIVTGCGWSVPGSTLSIAKPIVSAPGAAFACTTASRSGGAEFGGAAAREVRGGLEVAAAKPRIGRGAVGSGAREPEDLPVVGHVDVRVVRTDGHVQRVRDVDRRNGAGRATERVEAVP